MERSPVAKGRAGATEIISDLVVFAILSVSTALVLQVIPKQEQNPSDGGRYPLIGLEPGTPITLQEAGAKAAFTPPCARVLAREPLAKKSDRASGASGTSRE